MKNTVVYASTLTNVKTGERESQPIRSDAAILSELEWVKGVDNTPWKQPCEVARFGDTIYYRYSEEK